jgi:CAI-1 autoinducer synthase
MKIHSLNKSSQRNKTLPSFLATKLDQYSRTVSRGAKNGRPLILGKKPNRDSLMLQSNDYLSISKNPQIIEAQVISLKKKNRDAVMSAVFLHDDSMQRNFESEMAQYVGYEKAILCQSGWSANVGLMQVIAAQNTNVYIDFFAHMSLWEGIKSSGARAIPFRHNSANSLEKLIKKNGKGIIVVDSVYSTTGDVSPLKDVADIASRHGCVLVVDESHSLGTHGPKGAGLVADLCITDQVHFITASLAKTFAARAGIVLCSKLVADWFPYVSHPAIFSSALLPYEISGLKATLEVVKNSNQRRKKLTLKAKYLRDGLRGLGIPISSHSQIISLEGGREEVTENIRDELEARNIFGSVFCDPATPKNRSLVRFSINSDVSTLELNQIISACEEFYSSPIIAPKLKLVS